MTSVTKQYGINTMFVWRIWDVLNRFIYLPGVGVPEKIHSNFIVSASVVLISVISLTNVGGVWAAEI